jgi:hypothetical protein
MLLPLIKTTLVGLVVRLSFVAVTGRIGDLLARRALAMADLLLLRFDRTT